MKKKRYLANVYVWQNGMVMAFDQFGEQMPDYQGKLSEVKNAIKRDAPETCMFYGGDWQDKIVWDVAGL